MQSSQPLGTLPRTQTQRTFAWTERFGLPIVVSAMEASLVTAPLAYFVLLGTLGIPILGSSEQHPSLLTGFVEILVLFSSIFVVALCYYVLASGIERWLLARGNNWRAFIGTGAYILMTIIWIVLFIDALPDISVTWYLLVICWIAWRIIRIVTLELQDLPTLGEFINSTFRGGLGVLLGGIVLGVLTGSSSGDLAGSGVLLVLFLLCALCAVPLTHFVIACRAGNFPVNDEAHARATWMHLVLPMVLISGIFVFALALIGIFQWHPVPFSWPHDANAAQTHSPSTIGTPHLNKTPGSGNGTPFSSGTPGTSKGTPSTGIGTPTSNGTPAPGGGTSTGNNTPIPGTGTPIHANGTPSAGTPTIGGGTPGAYNGTGTPAPGIGVHGSPVAGATGTPINNSTTPEPGTLGNDTPTPPPGSLGTDTPTPPLHASPTPEPTPTRTPIPSPTPAQTVPHMPGKDGDMTNLLLGVFIVVLIMAAVWLTVLLLRNRQSSAVDQLRLTLAEPPEKDNPPFPGTTRAYYRAILQAAVDARSDLARRAMETPAEYAQRLQDFLMTPNGAKVLADIGVDAAEVETIVWRLTTAYHLVRYRGDVDTPHAHGWLRTWLPQLQRFFRQTPHE